MPEDGDEILDSENETTEEVENTDEVEETVANTESEDDGESLEDRLAKSEAANKKLFERTKKAEAEAKELKAKAQAGAGETETKTEAEPSKQVVTLTPMDAIILSKANISDQEDIEELISFAGYRKITVAQALKDKTMQTILRDRAEQRETAEATNVDGGRRGSSKPATEQILADADKGKFPDDPAELAKARAASKRKKNK